MGAFVWGEASSIASRNDELGSPVRELLKYSPYTVPSGKKMIAYVCSTQGDSKFCINENRDIFIPLGSPVRVYLKGGDIVSVSDPYTTNVLITGMLYDL